MIEIEKNIPMPEIKHQELKAVLHTMEIGDSILITTGIQLGNLQNIFTKFRPKKFTSRTQVDNSIRVWRLL